MQCFLILNDPILANVFDETSTSMFLAMFEKTRTKHCAHDAYFAMFFKAVENVLKNLTNFSNTKLRAAFQCQCTLQYMQSEAMWPENAMEYKKRKYEVYIT